MWAVLLHHDAKRTDTQTLLSSLRALHTQTSRKWAGVYLCVCVCMY
jgi:hypothetical protein